MAQSYSKGLFYKKIKNASGEFATKIPFLPKTLANLVVMNNGKNVQETIDGLTPHMVFESKSAYLTAYNAGNIPAGTVCIVKE